MKALTMCIMIQKSFYDAVGADLARRWINVHYRPFPYDRDVREAPLTKYKELHQRFVGWRQVRTVSWLTLLFLGLTIICAVLGGYCQLAYLADKHQLPPFLMEPNKFAMPMWMTGFLSSMIIAAGGAFFVVTSLGVKNWMDEGFEAILEKEWRTQGFELNVREFVRWVASSDVVQTENADAHLYLLNADGLGAGHERVPQGLKLFCVTDLEKRATRVQVEERLLRMGSPKATMTWADCEKYRADIKGSWELAWIMGITSDQLNNFYSRVEDEVEDEVKRIIGQADPVSA